ncbi:hypothetical protein OPT61_g7428 [Boeremia exigua]|uniref:Uncharacterized protein n=1 Tax=Boeremia exigua TaxID=749465 RepID=A0ACC2I3C5_9PLEO|nr:hypothetical protein OPT61_g7428 [Boeremia exigua]
MSRTRQGEHLRRFQSEEWGVRKKGQDGERVGGLGRFGSSRPSSTNGSGCAKWSSAYEISQHAIRSWTAPKALAKWLSKSFSKEVKVVTIDIYEAASFATWTLSIASTPGIVMADEIDCRVNVGTEAVVECPCPEVTIFKNNEDQNTAHDALGRPTCIASEVTRYLGSPTQCSGTYLIRWLSSNICDLLDGDQELFDTSSAFIRSPENKHLQITMADLTKPIVPAPDGYIVDLQNPQRRGEAVITWVGIIGMVIATTLLLIRVYTKVVLVKKMTSDDWCLILAWIFAMPVQSLIVYRAPTGLIGIHAWELTGHQLNTIARITLTTTVLYSPALAFAKLSFLCFYLYLNPATGFRTGVYFTMFVVVGSCVGIVVSLLAACNPFSRNIDVTVKDGQCLNKASLYIATGVLNIITDIMVIALPIPMVLGLQMSKSRKVMLVMLFSVGSITCITSAVRVALLPPMLTSKDSSWDTVYPSLWILIEASLIVITGTLPTMRLFLKHIAPSLIGETEATQPSTTRRESGWELQHRGTHDPYDIEDGSSEREIFNTKGETCG